MAAVHETARVSVVELPGLAEFSEVAIASDAEASEVAWIGAPPRLLVVATYSTHAIVHLVDPYGPRTVAELRLERPLRLFGVVGKDALLLGAHTAVVVHAGDGELTAAAFPARGGVPGVVGPGPECFVVALPGMLEEWDLQARIPKRRLKLSRMASVAAVGGRESIAWCVWQDDRARIDTFPFAALGQPRTHELPEPISKVATDPRSDLVVCVGADTGRIYVIDLDGMRGMRIVGASGIARPESVALVIGGAEGVLVAQDKRPLAYVALGAEPPIRRKSEPAPLAAPIDGPPTTVSLAAPFAAPFADARDWRYELVEWARNPSSEPPPAPAISHLLSRLELSPVLRSAVALLYGKYLAGEDGAAPVDVARVARGWAEALGRGELAARGVVVHSGARVRLAPAVVKALDEA
jgi:hypothetical protein